MKNFSREYGKMLVRKIAKTNRDASKGRANRWPQMASVVLRLLTAGFLFLAAGPTPGQSTAASVTKLAPDAKARDNVERQAKEWIARGTPRLALAVAVDGTGCRSLLLGPSSLPRLIRSLMTSVAWPE